MGKLRVFFVGVCSHLRENTSREAEHRVVLIDASAPDQKINGHDIYPHHAALRYTDPADGKPKKVNLDGVRITVPNASNPNVAYDDSFFACIPRLANYTKELPPLALEVVRDRNSVAAYFDASGRFSGGVDEHDASVAILNVGTNGNPQILIESFSDKRVRVLDLPDSTDVQIENVGPGGSGDQNHDFLISFKIARAIPADATWPTSAASTDFGVDLPFPGNTVDPGCSNSNYP